MNPERAILGLATVFGVPIPGHGPGAGQVLRPEQFADFVASGDAAKMIEHHGRYQITAAEGLGTWVAFRSVAAEGDQPAGLLALGQFGHSPNAEAKLALVREQFDVVTDNTPWRLSLSAGDRSADEDRSRLWVDEISLTTQPRLDGARVCGVGQYALDRWELLTGTPPPTVVATTRRTVRGRLLGLVGGKPVYEEWQE